MDGYVFDDDCEAAEEEGGGTEAGEGSIGDGGGDDEIGGLGV